jgi:hypothetical protein
MLAMESYFDQFVSLYEISDYLKGCTRSIGVAMRYLRKRGFVEMTQQRERRKGSRQFTNVRYFRITNAGRVAIGKPLR